MTPEDKTKPVWRGRALAVAGLAAALAGSGFVAAGAANAATTPPPTAPSLTLTAPASITNDGTGSAAVSLEINNSQAGNQPIGSTPSGTPSYTVAPATLTIVITAPSGVLCSNITLTPGTTNPTGETFPNFTPTGTAGTCTYTDNAYTQPQNSDYTFNYTGSINAVGSSTPTGTVTATASISEVATTTSNGNTATISATSKSTSTLLAAPAAPTFNSTAAPLGTVYSQYSFAAVASSGVPSVTPTQYRAFGTPTSKTANNGTTYVDGIDNTTTNHGSYTVYNRATGNYDVAIPLYDTSDSNTGFYFDTVTGTIVNDGLEGTSAFPDYTWTIIANNGQGGATTAQPEGLGGTTAQPTPAINVNDVVSPAYTLEDLFSDVATNSTFAQQIYALSNTGIIGGYADGTFRPTTTVTRQAFVHFVAEYILFGGGGGGIGTGTCSTNHPSAFPDVPNNSQFCTEIRDLASVGIISGYADGGFHPTATISRQAIAAFLYRTYQYEVTGGSVSDQNPDAVCTTPIPFNDVTASNPFCGDIEFLHTQGVSNGYADGGYHPTAGASRQATAALIYNLFSSSFV